MKTLFKTILTGLLLTILFKACTSPQKLLEQGNYYDAVILSVEKIKKNPDHAKARETLKQAYPLAVENLLEKIEKKRSLQPEFFNTFSAHTYEDLNRMYEAIMKSPVAREIIRNPEKFYLQLSKVKTKAAEEQYQAGMKYLAYGDRENAKKAYYYFQDAGSFVPNYKDISQKSQQAYQMALLHVIADLKPVQSRIYRLSANTFYEKLLKSLHKIEKGKFIRFYTPKEANEYQLKNPDQILQVNFEDFVVGETHSSEYVENLQKDSVIVGQVSVGNGRKKNVYGTVKAKFSFYRMEVVSRGLVNLNIKNNDYKETILINEDFPGEYVWFNEWGRYNGDQRALTNEQLDICNGRRIPPPPPQQMFVEFTKPIFSQLNNKLKKFYSRY